jgi:hypothetical protein
MKYIKLNIIFTEEYFIKTIFRYISKYIKKDMKENNSNILFFDYENNYDNNIYYINFDFEKEILELYLTKIEKYIKNIYPEFGSKFLIKYDFL